MQRALCVAIAIMSAGCGMVAGIEEKEYVEENFEQRVIALSALNCTTCAVREDGSVWCWGSNEFGQLGQDDGFKSDGLPVRVPLPDGVEARDVSVGTMHACAITRADEVYCWGSNAAGQADPETFPAPDCSGSVEPVQSILANRVAPQRVNLGAGIRAVSVSAGALHTCALTADKEVYCWGSNHAGQCGVSLRDSGLDEIFRREPTDGICGWSVGSVGEVLCNQPDDLIRYPAPVPGLSNADKLVVQRNTSCAFGRGFGIKCWGNNCGAGGESGVESILGNDCNVGGQLGAPPTGLCFKEEPGVPGGLGTQPLRGFNMGHVSGFAVLGPAGEVRSWGWNGGGQLGHSATSGFSAPSKVLLDQAVEEVARTNGLHQFARGEDHLHYSWGTDHCGELGRLDLDLSPALPAVAGRIPRGATDLSSGQDHACFLLDGWVHCLGHRNFVGQAVLGQPQSCGGEDFCSSTDAVRDPVEVRFE